MNTSPYTFGSVTDRHWMVVFRTAALVALGTSVALFLDYISPQPAFCSGQGGCAAVRESDLAYLPLGSNLQVPLPVFGVVGFAGLFFVSLWPQGRLWRRFGSALVYLSAAGGLALITLQAILGQFCPLCMIVDTSALIMAGAWWRAQRCDSFPSSDVLTRPAWTGLVGLVLVATLAYPRMVSRVEVPAAIAQLYEPGSITVVEFFDFQCPHCRILSPRLSALVAETKGVVLRMGYVPLPNHPAARPAARFAICAAEQGKEKEAVAAFMATPDLSPENLRSLTESFVPEPARLDACLKSPRPDQRIADDTRRLKEAGFVGLPTTYVGGVRLLGAQDDAAFRAAFEQVRAGHDRSGVNPWLYWAGCAALALALALMGRRRN